MALRQGKLFPTTTSILCRATRTVSRVGYFGRIAVSSEPLIIINSNQKDEIEGRYGEVYEQVQSNEQGGAFELRPGVDLMLYRRR